MYYCRTLTKDEIADTYKRYMKKDFPRDELKPLSRILSSLEKDQYICYGIFSGESLCGYAYLVSLTEEGKKYYLLDYFATVKKLRGQGIGSEFLKMLSKEVCSAEMLLCEAESTNNVSGDEARIRNRRIAFYLRNGFIDTGVTASVFGVEFVILELDLGKCHTKEQVRENYARLYRSFLPERLYRLFVRIC